MLLSAKKVLIIFCLLIGGFLWLQYTLSSNIIIERATIANLSNEKTSLREAISIKYALLSSYKGIAQKLETFQFTFPTDNVAFFAALERIMVGNGLRIIRINPISQLSAEHRTVVQVTCEGEYCKLIHALSEIRNNKMIMRLSSLYVAEKNTDCVSADMAIETIMQGE